MHEAERDGSALPAAKRKKFSGSEQNLDESEMSRERKTARTVLEFRAETLFVSNLRTISDSLNTHYSSGAIIVHVFAS